jgi:hypothetical protein
MNMMAYEYDGTMLVVDCGVMFPDAEMLGPFTVRRSLWPWRAPSWKSTAWPTACDW